jgi:hypothetical protein
MLPFDYSTMQAQSRSTSKSDTHRSQKSSEGKQMEVDSIITPKLYPTKLEVVSSTRNIFDIKNLYSDGEGSILVIAPTPTRVNLHSNDVTNLTLLNAIVKYDNKLFGVGTNVDAKALISI